MRSSLAICLAFAAMLVAGDGALAQSPLQGRTHYGTFGSRTMGQPLGPRPNQLANFQLGPSGNYLYRGNVVGATNFPTPWRRIDPSVYFENPRFLAAVQIAEQQALIQSSYQPIQMAPAVAPQATTAANQVVPANQVLPADLADLAAPGDMTVVAPPRPPALTTAGNVPAAPAIAMVHSATLSERITRVARQRGILEGERIDVSVGGNIARLEGAVRTAHDRQLLANIVGLEPTVYAVDNRLVVRSANATGGGQ